MKTKLLTANIPLVVFLCCVFGSNAQDRHDNTWLLGAPGTNPTSLQGGNFIHFDRGVPSISYFPSNTDLWVPCIMSDENGNLSWYSNGCKVQNKQFNLMDNGDVINAGIIHDTYCVNTGYPSGNSLLSIPLPGHDSLFYLFHIRISENFVIMDMLYTVIDMHKNNGLGKVVDKDVFMLSDSLGTSISAVKHGNGRDWWLIVGGQYNDDTYTYLIDSNGINQPPIVRHAPWTGSDLGPAVLAFSPDGSKLVRSAHGTPAVFKIYDFNRCTGEISNAVDVIIPDDEAFVSWPCFSPNSRYLYLTNQVTRLYQYDTWAPNISASVQLIDVYDGFLGDYNLATTMFTMTLGPDQRIYMSSNNSVRYLHTIHKPNEPGIACDFRQHDFQMPALSLFFLPNMPNYRLYNLTNSPCDTLNIETPFLAQWRYENDSLNNPLSFNFTDVSFFEPTNWKWHFGDGDSSSLPSPIHIYTSPGVYEVCLETCNETGKCDTLCRNIMVKTVDTDAPVLHYEKNNIHLWPNPAIHHIWISRDGISNGELSIFDLTGHQVFYTPFSNYENVTGFSLPKLPSGMYFCQVRSQGRLLKTEKLIIQQ